MFKKPGTLDLRRFVKYTSRKGFGRIDFEYDFSFIALWLKVLLVLVVYKVPKRGSGIIKLLSSSSQNEEIYFKGALGESKIDPRVPRRGSED